jgi:hypothetical protein
MAYCKSRRTAPPWAAIGSAGSPSVGPSGHRRTRLDGRGGALSSTQTSNGSPRELVRRAAVELTAWEWEDPSSRRLTKRSRIAQLREVNLVSLHRSAERPESVIVGAVRHRKF